MLAPYRALLDELRRDPARWSELAYRPSPGPDGRGFDEAYATRLGVLVCLQYDRRPEDESLVRYLFKEEIRARQEDPFQGETEVLQLGAFLLAGYRRPDDLVHFVRAKLANFDTFSAFDTGYLALLDAEGTLERLLEEHAGTGELRSTLLEWLPTDPEELESWWREKQREYPASEAAEDLLTLTNRALELGALEEGRRYLDRWEQQAPHDGRTLSTLIHYRDALGQPEQALWMAERVLAEAAGDPWAEVSARRDVALYRLKAGHLLPAWESLQECWRSISGNREWRQMGIARMTVELMLELAQAAASHEPALGREVFRQARRCLPDKEWSCVMLGKAAEAATSLGLEEPARHYRRLEAAESKRIHRQIYGERA